MGTTNKALRVQGHHPTWPFWYQLQCSFCLNCSWSTNRCTYTRDKNQFGRLRVLFYFHMCVSQFNFFVFFWCGFEIIFPFGVASLGVGRRVGRGGPCVDERLNDHALFSFFWGVILGCVRLRTTKTAHLSAAAPSPKPQCVTRPQPTSAPSIGNLLWLNCQWSTTELPWFHLGYLSCKP